jgi:hypothetical protein
MIREWLYSGFLNDDEEILLVVHRHLKVESVNFLRILVLGIGVPVFFYWLFPQVLPFAAVWAWLGFMRLIYGFFDWYYDAWLVTDISIIHVTWDGFFKKSGTRTEYHHIDSIGYEISGFFATLFNYGAITIEKETGNRISFDNAASPKKKVDQMMQFQDHFVTKKNVRDHKTLKGMMTDMLGHHFREHLSKKDKQK